MNILVSAAWKDGKLVFDPIDLLAWAILDDADYPQEIVGLFGAKVGESRVAWRLEIDEQAKKIRCALSEKDAVVAGTTVREFEFRPGTLVLEDPQGMEDPLMARVKNFRQVRFQEFVDDFGLQNVCRHAKPSYFWPAACRWQSYKERARRVTVVKGGAVQIIRNREGVIKGFRPWQQASCWVLEVIETDDGEARILHTNMLSLRKLREGLLRRGVRLVR